MVLRVQTSEMTGMPLCVNVCVAFFPIVNSFPCQHFFCSCSQHLQESKWAETTIEDFLSSIHRSNTDFSLHLLASALYYLLHLMHGHHTNADDFLFLVALGCELRCWYIQSKWFSDSATLPVHFPLGSPSLICLAWLLAEILLISASQVTKIIDMSHQQPGQHWSFNTDKSHNCCCGLVSGVLE
jgi:hypothetical protein